MTSQVRAIEQAIDPNGVRCIESSYGNGFP
jgi:hypothetical protein